jgi:hypothetical protein
MLVETLISASFQVDFWYVLGRIFFYQWWIIYILYCSWVVPSQYKTVTNITKDQMASMCMTAMESEVMRYYT